MPDREELVLAVRSASGQPVPARVVLEVEDAAGERTGIPGKQRAPGEMVFELESDVAIVCAHVGPEVAGLWNLCVDAPTHNDVVICPSLPTPIPDPWWLRALGLDRPVEEAYDPIRVGIIDTDYTARLSQGGVAVVDIFGAPTLSPCASAWGHGEAIYELVASTTRPTPSVPLAQIVCVDAGSPDGGIMSEGLASAVVHLATRPVDLISLSWGGFVDPNRPVTEIPELSGMIEAITFAREMGTLCIVAAGNHELDEAISGVAAFPAILPECIGVGAVGLRGWGPTDSQARWYEGQASGDPARLGHLDPPGDIYAWPLSAAGRGVDVSAPGVGIPFTRGTQPGFELTGTSFAAPLAAAAFARTLAFDSIYRTLKGTERTDYARELLLDTCRRSGMATDFEGAGLPWAEL